MNRSARVAGLRSLFVCLALVTANVATTADASTPTEASSLLSTAKAQMVSNPISARRTALAAEAAAQSLTRRRAKFDSMAEAQWLQAEAALRLNDFSDARLLIDRSLVSLGATPRSTKLLGDVRLTRAGINAGEGRFSSALMDYQAAHGIFRKVGDARGQAKALVSIGVLYVEADDRLSALKYYARALDIYSGDSSFVISVMINQASALQDLDHSLEAREKLASALKLARGMNSPLWNASILANMARLAVKANDLSAADVAVEQGFRASGGVEGDDVRRQLQSIAAEIALKRKNYGRARTLIEAALAGQNPEQTAVAFREIHYAAYATYLAVGDDKRALTNLQAMKRLDDEVAKLTTNASNAVMAARFDSANKDARISGLQAAATHRQLALLEARASFQRVLAGAIAGAVLIVLGLLGTFLFQSRRAQAKLGRANSALKSALSAKTDFLAATSHEIRTPLNGILGMTQVMLADPKLEPSAKERVEIVHAAGMTMRSMVDDILDVAKMEAGFIAIEERPFNLAAMMQDVTRIWAEQARAKGLWFRVDLSGCPAGMMGDIVRIRQVVYNLVSNAVKFTISGGVTVRVALAGEWLVVDIVDTGIGISAEKHERVFAAFEQADASTTRRYGGTGLGLAIVKNIVEAMRGSISLQSVPGDGSKFTVSLPFQSADMAADEVCDHADGILIVEANPIARAMLRSVFAARASAMSFVGSIDEALVKLRAHQFSRVVVDDKTLQSETVGNPFQALTTIASATSAAVVVLWSDLDPGSRAALTKAGVSRVVEKPIAGPALAAAVFAEFPGSADATVAA